MKPIQVQIREAREALGWSQNELGRRAGLTGKAIWKIEQGNNTTIETVDRIAQALGMSLECSLRLPVGTELAPDALGQRVLSALPRASDGALGILAAWLELVEAQP